jgi:hypothetical protein
MVDVVHGKDQPYFWKSAATTQVDLDQPSVCRYTLSDGPRFNTDNVFISDMRIDTIASPTAFSGSAIELVTKALLGDPTESDFSFSGSSLNIPATAAAHGAREHSTSRGRSYHSKDGRQVDYDTSRSPDGPYYTGRNEQYRQRKPDQQGSYGPHPPAYPSEPSVSGIQMYASPRSFLGITVSGNDTNATGLLGQADFNSFGECRLLYWSINHLVMPWSRGTQPE